MTRLYYTGIRRRKKEKYIHYLYKYKTRVSEGYHEILINDRLKEKEIKFGESFRLSRHKFDFISSIIIRNDSALNPTFFISKPILAEEKLAATTLGQVKYINTNEKAHI